MAPLFSSLFAFLACVTTRCQAKHTAGLQVRESLEEGLWQHLNE